jgi:hypothetical protein
MWSQHFYYFSFFIYLFLSVWQDGSTSK